MIRLLNKMWNWLHSFIQGKTFFLVEYLRPKRKKHPNGRQIYARFCKKYRYASLMSNTSVLNEKIFQQWRAFHYQFITAYVVKELLLFIEKQPKNKQMIHALLDEAHFWCTMAPPHKLLCTFLEWRMKRNGSDNIITYNHFRWIMSSTEFDKLKRKWIKHITPILNELGRH